MTSSARGGLGAARERLSDEDVSKLLSEIVLKSLDGDDVETAGHSVGISDATDYNSRRHFGGMRRSQLFELKSLEQVNSRLKKIIA